jgi:hypothetical protein
MHYLPGIMEYGIHYSRYHVVLEAYSDANWISDVDELYAMSGYVFLAVLLFHGDHANRLS